MKDNGNFPFLANQTGKFSCLMTSRQTLFQRYEGDKKRPKVLKFINKSILM